MLQDFFDQKPVRLSLAASFGLPVSLAAAVGALYSLLLCLGGIKTGRDPAPYVLILVVTLVGLAGISGAWCRVLRPRTEMTGADARMVRILIGGGVLSALVLAFGAATWVGSFWLAAAFFALGGVGIALVLATPARPAASPPDGGAK